MKLWVCPLKDIIPFHYTQNTWERGLLLYKITSFVALQSLVVTICTAQWSLYVPHSGHYMYRKVVTTCTAKWSLYVPQSGHYMYGKVVTTCTAKWSLYVPHSGHYMYRKVVIICTAKWSLYVPPACLTSSNATFCPHSSPIMHLHPQVPNWQLSSFSNKLCCDIWVSHSGVHKASRLLGCDAGITATDVSNNPSVFFFFFFFFSSCTTWPLNSGCGSPWPLSITYASF